VIRINLVETDRLKVRRAPFARDGRILSVACALPLLTALAGTGGWYWSLARESVALDRSLADAEQERSRLRSVLDQVKQFEMRRTQLQQRVTLIEELRRGQSGPVVMLDQISRNVPDMLWLTELKQRGSEVTIDGRTASLVALSDFVGNLESSTHFQRPVEIVSSQVEPLPDGEVVRFSVRAVFAPAVH
jgi:type IV pilus assembly protein PilN